MTICKQQSNLITHESAADLLSGPAKMSMKHISPYIVVYLVKVSAIDTAFQEFIFIMKYCPFMSTFCAHSLSSISFKNKKILLGFQTYKYPKRCAQMFIHRMT